jgi:predicted nuclease with RNAse H fold
MLLTKIGASHPPRIVGIDLRGNPGNPTGWALCEGSDVTTLEVYDDLEIVSLTLEAKPDIVSIDAPLALPRGRVSAFDDSPCRERGGVVRDAERILWSRGIGVYPALIPHMQGLTNRGIDLATTLRGEGLKVIESYPGAAQDILGIPRKKRDLSLLRQGLIDFGFVLDGTESHDELDAATSAMVGYFYLADQYEGLGADDECYLIVPRWEHLREWV